MQPAHQRVRCIYRYCTPNLRARSRSSEMRQCRYDRADLTFRSIVDIQVVAAMAPAGGGRHPLSPRLLRHFNQLAINEFSASTYQHVYTTMFAWWAQIARLPSDVAAMRCKIVDATLSVYAAVRAELLPTPAKGHYTFNMRDISKIFQGMQSVGTHVSCTTGALQAVMYTCDAYLCQHFILFGFRRSTGVVLHYSGCLVHAIRLGNWCIDVHIAKHATPVRCATCAVLATGLARLWAHEAMRVLHDRLICAEDRDWMLQCIKKQIDGSLGLQFVAAFPSGNCTQPEGTTDNVAGLRELLFCNFAKVCSILGMAFSFLTITS